MPVLQVESQPSCPQVSEKCESPRKRACPGCQSSQSKLLFVRDGYRLVECDECQLAFIENIPTPEEFEAVYSFDGNYHSDFAESEQARKEYTRRAEKLFRYVKKYRGSGDLLDVGCSAGFFLKVAQDAGFHVQGLEFSRDTADLGRRLFDVPIECGTLGDQSAFAPESFDVITLWDVIEHVADPLADLRHVYDLLRPGGYLFMTTPNIDGLYPRVAQRLIPLTNFWSHPGPPYHLSQFSERTLGDLVKKAGMTVKRSYHRQIPMDTEFGRFRDVIRSPKYLSYTLALSPFALLGPWIHQGDDLVMVVQKTA